MGTLRTHAGCAMCLPGKYIQVDGGRDGVRDAVQGGRDGERTRGRGTGIRKVMLGGQARLGRSPPAAPRRGGRRDSTTRSWRSDPLFKMRRVTNQNPIGLGVLMCRPGCRHGALGQAKRLGPSRSRRKRRRRAGPGSRTHFRRRQVWGSEGLGRSGAPPAPGAGKTGGKTAPRRGPGPPGRLGAGGEEPPPCSVGAGSARGDPAAAGPAGGRRPRTFLSLALLGYWC